MDHSMILVLRRWGKVFMSRRVKADFHQGEHMQVFNSAVNIRNGVGESRTSRMAAVILAIALCAPGASIAQARTSEAAVEALVKAAKAENVELTMYVGYTENVARRTVNAFIAKYGIRTQFLRTDAGNLLQRYSAEAEAGKVAADLAITSGGLDRRADGQDDPGGWFEPVKDANIPVIASGEYPAKFIGPRTAVVQLTPWLLVYNSDQVKGADIPKDWPELLNPKWKGNVIVNDPRVSDAFMEFWGVLLDDYGPGFFDKLRPSLRRVLSPVPAVQGLGAGEGAFVLPVVSGQVQGVREKGAPLEMVQPDLTTGVLLRLVLTARSKAKAPAAARLFANWVLSPEGNKVVNSDPGNFTMYDTDRLPKRYTVAVPLTAARRDTIRKLLGYE